MGRNDRKINTLLHTPEGVRDIYGEELLRKQAVLRATLHRMHLYGYEDIQTPAFEFFDVFSKEIGTTPSAELYKFFDKNGNTLVLRPDFTPSMARCAAKYYKESTEPVRFCYSGNTFTNTSSLQGKLRESTQTGVEFINDGSAEADAETIALLVDCLRGAGLSDFQISLGNADYFRGICLAAGIDAETEYELRELISGKNYFGAEKLLVEEKIDASVREKILKVTDYIGSTDALAEAAAEADNDRSRNAVERLQAVYRVLGAYGVDRYISFDLSMLSKYNYYTGIIFKGFTYGVGDVIATGGRYDTLIGQFGKDAPAVGFMIPIDTLMEALRRQEVDVAVPVAPRKILYTDADYPEKLREVLALRAQGIAADLCRKQD